MNLKVISYNVNNSYKAIEDLVALCDDSYDMILISIQEFYWFMLDKFMLGRFKNYEHKSCENIWGIVCLILSKEKFDVEYKKVCFGSFYLGNKGYILCLINKKIIFLSAHLSHGQKNERRELEFKKMLEDIVEVDERVPVIVAGDLNFRMDLKRVDQLHPLLELYSLFEHPINFPPTYKYSKNSDFDLRRIPSFCDRILFRNLQVNNYKSISDFNNSDHKPVVLTGRIIPFDTSLNISSPCYFSSFMSSIFEYSLLFCLCLYAFSRYP